MPALVDRCTRSRKLTKAVRAGSVARPLPHHVGLIGVFGVFILCFCHLRLRAAQACLQAMPCEGMVYKIYNNGLGAARQCGQGIQSQRATFNHVVPDYLSITWYQTIKGDYQPTKGPYQPTNGALSPYQPDVPGGSGVLLSIRSIHACARGVSMWGQHVGSARHHVIGRWGQCGIIW